MEGLLIIVGVMFVGLSALVIPTIIADRKNRTKPTEHHLPDHQKVG